MRGYLFFINMQKIVWNYNKLASQNEGYRTSSEMIMSHLISMGVDIEIYDDHAPIGVMNLVSQSIDTPPLVNHINDAILINNTLPTDYRRCNGYNIGFSYWETTKIPTHWVDKMNSMDEIWTTSKFVKEAFINSGVKVPVYSFSLGIDEKLYYPTLRKRHNPFTFLSIGSPSTRKNSQMTVDAFIKLFGNNDQFKLIYKSMGSPDARLNRGTSNIKSIHSYPTIEVIEDDLSNIDLARLYDRVNCLVYPTSGEGWGWFPFQSIAKGIPTICPNGTACSEYAGMSLELDFEWSDEGMFGLYSNCGEWMKPNFNDLCDKMLDVVNNYDLHAMSTYQNSKENFESMTWSNAIKDYYNRLCQILKK